VKTGLKGETAAPLELAAFSHHLKAPSQPGQNHRIRSEGGDEGEHGPQGRGDAQPDGQPESRADLRCRTPRSRQEDRLDNRGGASGHVSASR